MAAWRYRILGSPGSRQCCIGFLLPSRRSFKQVVGTKDRNDRGTSDGNDRGTSDGNDDRDSARTNSDRSDNKDARDGAGKGPKRQAHWIRIRRRAARNGDRPGVSWGWGGGRSVPTAYGSPNGRSMHCPSTIAKQVSAV